MPALVSTPHCPFDRLWQPGHPFRARRSKCRRWTMALLLIFMSGIISSYWYLTDPARIKAMSQSYLSELVGGNVQIGTASLTVFEGLKLTKVSVQVDRTHAADSGLFFADAIEIQYDPAALLRGRLEATRIIATGAKVNLVENSAAGKWNYQRLHRPQGKSPLEPQPDGRKLLLPELVLRDAEVKYSEMINSDCIGRGAMDISGQFLPSVDRTKYAFELQSRGAIEGVGPVVSGQVTLSSGQVDAKLSHLQFGQDVEAMLPRDVRQFWQAHKVEGALNIQEFSYTPATRHHPEKFRLRTELTGVKLVFHSEEFDAPPTMDPALANQKGFIPWAQRLHSDAARMIYLLHAFPERPPIAVNNVTGSFYFDENGVSFDKVSQTIAGATLLVSGRMQGYSPDAPVWVRFESKPGEMIQIPEHPDFLASLPTPLLDVYMMIKPHGTGALWAEVNRALPNSFPQVTGEISIKDGFFDSIFFPYPVEHARGKVLITPDPTRKYETVTVEDVHGKGVAGGPNADRDFELTGTIGINNPNLGCRIRARGSGITMEPPLYAAFPAAVRKAISIFKGAGDDAIPYFAGSFDCNVYVPPGAGQRPIVSVDLDFTDGRGKLAAFPYPLENLHGSVSVRDGYLTMDRVNLRHGSSTLDVSGKVTWPTNTPDGQPVIAKPDLRLVGRNLPIDAELLKVLPPDARYCLKHAGVTGKLDLDGRVIPKAIVTNPDDCVDYDMDVTLRDGAAHPADSDFAVTDMNGEMQLHPDRLEILSMHSKRGDASFASTGSLDWSTNPPMVKLNASATRLTLDKALLQMLPPDAKQAWITLDPHGTVDANLLFHGAWSPPGAAMGDPVASLSVPANALPMVPVKRPKDFQLTIKPTDVTFTAKPFPYQMDHCTGTVVVTPENVILQDIHARHGPASIAIAGKAFTADPNNWDLVVKADGISADEQLRNALPLPMRQVLEQLKYKGSLSVDLGTFRYRGDRPEADIDLSGTLAALDGSVDVGVPIDKMNGALKFDAAVRNGKLSAFRGDLAMEQMSLADRPIRNFRTLVHLPPGSDTLRAADIRGELAGGELAGQMDLIFPDHGPSSYLLDFKVKNADLREMAQQVAGKNQDIRGQASASLALRGEWADPSTRRGRGDVTVAGKEMYQIPLLLGLLEVTNLSLPTSNPFSEGTARYLVEGNRITFQQVQMRSKNLVMSGNGWMDFGSKQVRMNFTTENPNLPTLPLVGGLINTARNELLQIQVRGTIQSPKVSAAAMHTFTTTVDEVFSGSGKEK